MSKRNVIPEGFAARLSGGDGAQNPAVAHVLAAQSAPDADPLDAKDVETLTTEILSLKARAGEAIIGIGKRLLAVKAKLPHGEWLPWLEERVEFTERTAQRFMKIAQEWTNPTTLSDLGASKALKLLSLPEGEREAFVAETHVVNGEAKAVADMSARELQQAVRERNEALKSLKDARDTIQGMQVCLRSTEQARDAEIRQRQKIAEELDNLKKRPVDVAVQVDNSQRVRAERAEATLNATRNELARVLDETYNAKEEIENLREALEAAEAKLKAAPHGDTDLATFQVLYAQTQAGVNQMHDILLKVKDPATADGLKKALSALADAIRRCAE